MASRSAVSFAVAAALTVVSSFGSTSARAQDQDADVGLEEVTVTATRRTDTNLQETPISVTAVTAADIDRGVSKDLSALAASVPGFSASRITAFNAASFAMRGVGLTDIIVYQDSPVGVQVDDFVMPSVQTQLLDTFDMASVEVLRGPQGTTFGKNTTGGAVQIRTKRPDMRDFGGQVRLGAAKFGEKTIQAAFDLPIAEDVFAVRVVASQIKSDGYYRLGADYGPIVSFNTNCSFNTTTAPCLPPPAPQVPDFAPFNIPGITGQRGGGTGERTGGQDSIAGRIKAQWNVSENFTALFQYELLRDRSDAVPSYNDTPPGAPYFWNALGFTRPAGDPIDNVASTQRQDSLLRMGDGQEIDVDGAYINLEWALSDSYKLYSVTGYRKQTEHLPNTYTGAAPVNSITGQPLSLFDATRDTSRDTFQQELRFASTLDGPINYVAGAFFQRNDARFCVVQLLGFVDLITNWAAAMLPQQLLNNSPQILCNKQASDSLAGFIDGTWDVTDRFQLGAGFRYTRDERSWEGRTQTGFEAISPAQPTLNVSAFSDPLQAGNFRIYPGAPFNPATCSPSLVNSDTVLTCVNPMTGVQTVLDYSNLERTWSEPSWRVTGSFKMTPDVFAYGTVSRGYKAGGYNDQTGTSGILVPELTRPVDPEFATNFEIGFKTEWLDNRLRINPTVFFTEYKDAQRAANIITLRSGTPFQETVYYNAAEVSAKGAELEVQALFTDSFRIRVAASYLDAKYDNFVINQPSIVVGPNEIQALNQDLTGLPVPRSPELSGSIAAIYDLDLANGGKLQFSGDVYYEDENLFYISAVGRDFDAYLDEKTLLNAAVSWTSPDERWTARVYGKNLSDERYRIASQSVATLWTHSQFGEPRNFGVQVGYNFGKGEPRPVAPKDSDGDGVTDDIDRCPGTPAGTRVDASGCPLPADSDGDGVTDDKDRCPGTPAGTRVDANGCEADSDGDGVADSKDQCPNTPAGVKVGPNGCEVDSDGDGVVDSLDKCPDTAKGDRVDANGCTFKEEIKLPGVVFETNSADLKIESNPILDGAVATLKRYPDIVVEVAGHTDSVGSDAYNLALSKRRAEAVMKYLADNGVTNKMTARGYGERQPIASNANDAGRAQNRRVVLRVIE
jgi:iron complex outermembrane recepter protein